MVYSFHAGQIDFAQVLQKIRAVPVVQTCGELQASVRAIVRITAARPTYVRNAPPFT
jgi:hypothetical protein